MTALRVGIIGCGVIAPTHIKGYQAEDGVEVTWACDLVEDKARALAQRFGIPRVTTSASQVFAADDVDAVSVCTDHASHADLCCRALEAGKHILCEKALAPTTQDLDAMMACQDLHQDLVFAGVFQHRFNRVFQVIKRRIEEGAFGEILTAGVRMHCFRSDDYYKADAWRGTWKGEGGSVLINQAIHMIDVLAWILGGVQEVSASYCNRTHNDSIETEDTAVAVLKFRQGALGTLKATCSSHYAWRPIVSVDGTAGSVEVFEGTVQRLDFADAKMQQEMADELAAAAEPIVDAGGKAYYGGHHPLQIADFVNAIREKRSPFVSARQARHAVDLVLGIYESHRSGRWVRLPEANP